MSAAVQPVIDGRDCGRPGAPVPDPEQVVDLSIERGALGLRLYFNALGHSSPNQIGSEIASSWPM